MLPRVGHLRAAPRSTSVSSFISGRTFHTSRAQLSSPYHYPEGPYSNLPFNPRTRSFKYKYWAFMSTGMGLPFVIAYFQSLKSAPSE